MIVREATPSDAEAISVVHVASWQVAYRGQVPESYLSSMAVTPRWIENWRTILETNAGSGQRTFVAEDGGVVGFAHVGPSRDDGAAPDTGELWSIYAAPDRYGTGVGRALMARAVSALRERYREATLWVLDGNARARRFYGAAGWQPDGAVQPIEIGGATLSEVRYRLQFVD